MGKRNNSSPSITLEIELHSLNFAGEKPNHISLQLLC